jgi:hypothetical protein
MMTRAPAGVESIVKFPVVTGDGAPPRCIHSAALTMTARASTATPAASHQRERPVDNAGVAIVAGDTAAGCVRDAASLVPLST